jgi:hypothetical protein
VALGKVFRGMERLISAASKSIHHKRTRSLFRLSCKNLQLGSAGLRSKTRLQSTYYLRSKPFLRQAVCHQRLDLLRGRQHREFTSLALAMLITRTPVQQDITALVG